MIGKGLCHAGVCLFGAILETVWGDKTSANKTLSSFISLPLHNTLF